MSVWKAYFKKMGPANDMRRFDRLGAMVAQALYAVNGKKVKLADFMPFGIEEVEPNIDDILGAFGKFNVKRG